MEELAERRAKARELFEGWLDAYQKLRHECLLFNEYYEERGVTHRVAAAYEILLCHWHNQQSELADLRAELALWKPMTLKEAEAAYDAAVAEPMSDEEIDAIVARVTDPTYRPTEPEHVQMAAKIEQLRSENERLRDRLSERGMI